MTPTQIAAVLEGLIPLVGGAVACRYGYGGLGAKRESEPRWVEWKKRYGGVLKVCGPLLILFGLGTASAPFLKGPGPAVEDHPYYPMKVGSTWVYATSGAGDVTSRITAHELAAGVLCARREALVNGKVLVADHLRPDQGILHKLESNTQIYTPPLPIVKDLKGPAGWEYKSTTGPLSLQCTQADGGPVKTPMGTFEQTVLVTLKGTDKSGEIFFQQWFAPGVGIVREVSKTRGKTFSMELKSFAR